IVRPPKEQDMIDWIANNPLTVLAILAFLLAAGYALHLRSKMAASKARFALAAIATIASCLFAFLAFASGSGYVQVINTALPRFKYTMGLQQLPDSINPPDSFSMFLGVVVTVIVAVLIYRFSAKALATWEGPVTINVNELAKRDQDNSLPLLAYTELQR